MHNPDRCRRICRADGLPLGGISTRTHGNGGPNVDGSQRAHRMIRRRREMTAVARAAAGIGAGHYRGYRLTLAILAIVAALTAARTIAVVER